MTSTVGRGPLQRLRSATSLTSLRRREDGIHVLLESFQVAWNVVQHRLHRNPAEVRQRDEWGRTVLYHAISRRVDDSPPVSLVEYLVEVFPEAVHRDTNGGRCPLHAACHRRAPLPVLQAFMRSRDGEVSDCLALCAFHDSYCKLFGESALVSFISEGDGKEACSILIRLELLLRYCASTGQEGTVDEWFPIHTAAALPYCSVGILEIFFKCISHTTTGSEGEIAPAPLCSFEGGSR